MEDLGRKLRELRIEKGMTQREAALAIGLTQNAFMNYENTELNFLRADVVRKFGEEEGEKIFNRSAKLYAELAVTTDYKKSRTLERQLKSLVYPVIAYYKTLLAFGYRESSALGLVREETSKAAQESAGNLANQMRPIFPFHAFKRNIRNFIEYKFPSEAWAFSSLRVRGRRISFGIDRCLYHDITEKFPPAQRSINCQISFDGAVRDL